MSSWERSMFSENIFSMFRNDEDLTFRSAHMFNFCSEGFNLFEDKPDDQYLDRVQLNFDEEFGSNLKSKNSKSDRQMEILRIGTIQVKDQNGVTVTRDKRTTEVSSITSQSAEFGDIIDSSTRLNSNHYIANEESKGEIFNLQSGFADSVISQTKLNICQQVIDEKSLTFNSSITNFKTSKPIRVDVLNKTVIRSIKKYYTQLFEIKNPKYEREIVDIKVFEELTSNFTLHLFNPLLCELYSEGVTYENIIFCLRMLIQPELTRKTTKTREQRFLMNDYYDCINKYSHKRLLKLSKNLTFMYLFKKFIKSGLFRQHVQNDDNLMQNSGAYLEAGEMMLKLFGK